MMGVKGGRRVAAETRQRVGRHVPEPWSPEEPRGTATPVLLEGGLQLPVMSATLPTSKARPNSAETLDIRAIETKNCHLQAAAWGQSPPGGFALPRKWT